jgi:hypothetical protein
VYLDGIISDGLNAFVVIVSGITPPHFRDSLCLCVFVVN